MSARSRGRTGRRSHSRTRRNAVAAPLLCAAAGAMTLAVGGLSPAAGQTVVLQNGSLVLPSVDALGNAVLAVENGTLALGTFTFAKPPAAAPYFRNDVVTSANGLILGNGKSFALAGNISGNGGVSVIPASLTVGTWTLMGANTFTGPVRVDAAPGATQATLNMLAFDGPGAIGSAGTITLNGVGAAVGFLGGAAPYTVLQPMTTTGGSLAVLNRGSRADITYAGPISGASGGLTRVGTGVLTLAGNNSFAGGFTSAAAADAVTVVAADPNLGPAGGTVTLQGGTLRLGPGFAASGRPLRFGNGGGGLDVAADVVWSGPISNVGVVPGSITKTGLGNLTVTNSANAFGSLTIAGGSITVGGAGGRLLAAGSIGVGQGAALVVDNSAAALTRLNAAAAMNLSGGTFRLIGNGTANTSAVSTAALSVGSALGSAGQGLAVVRLEPGDARHALVRFGSLGRVANNGAQVLFSGAGMGDLPIASLSPGRSNVQFTTAPAMVNGIIPIAIVDSGAGLNLATYTTTNGVMPVLYGSSTLNNPGTPAINVVVGSDATVAGGSTVNAVEFTGGTVNLSAGTLGVTSGAMLFTGPTTITGGTLTVGVSTANVADAPTANLFVHADTTIASRLFVFANNGGGNDSGIAKSGPGVLTLSNTANSFQTPARVLEGTLRLGAANVIPNGAVVSLNPGATFDLNGFSEAVASIGQPMPPPRTGNDAVGTVLVGNATLTLTGDGVISTAIGHDILGAGNVVKGGTGTLTVVGGQAFSGTVSIAGGTLELATHDARGIGLANVARINLGTAANADVALRIDEGARAFDRPVSVQAPTGRTATLAFDDGVGIAVTAPITVANVQGLIIDASGGPTLAGLISGTGPVVFQSTGIGETDSGRSSIRVGGPNSYAGTTTVAARTLVFSHQQAFGTSLTQILLGSTDGDDNPELSGDAAMTLTRSIRVQDSFNGSVTRAAIGSRAPAGAGTLAYAGSISIGSVRNRLAVFSLHDGAPVSFTGQISGQSPAAHVQVGTQFSDDDDVTTRSTVYLSGANTYAGGTTLAAGTLGIAGQTVTSGSAVVNSPIGTGPLTIGLDGLAPGHAPTLVAAGQPRIIANAVSVTRDFAIAGPNPLTLAGTIDLGDAQRTVRISDQTAAFTGPIAGTGSAGLTKAGPGALILSTANTLPGSLTVTGGTLTAVAAQRAGGAIAVQAGGTIRVTGSDTATLVGASVSIDTAGGGVLDLTTRGLIVDYAGASPLAGMTALLASGRDGGTWAGAGIHSSTAAAAPGMNYAVGVAESAELGVTSFLGQPFAGDALLLRYTLEGDNNLDGTVGIADFSLLAANFNQPGGWFDGDYDYDGATSIADFSKLAANFNLSAAESAGARPAAVPEPGGLIAAVSAAAGLAVRRRRTA